MKKLLKECLKTLKKPEVQNKVKEIMKPYIELILNEMYPYIYLSLLFVLISFFFNFRNIFIIIAYKLQDDIIIFLYNNIMALAKLFGGRSKSKVNKRKVNQRQVNQGQVNQGQVNQRSRKQGGNPEWVLPAALLLGQKLYHSSSNAHIGNKRHKKSRKSRRSRKKRSGRSRRR